MKDAMDVILAGQKAAAVAKVGHTPGPWEVVYEGHRLSVWAEGYGFVHTHEVPQVNTGATETANANARLIAAVPELLAALTEILYSAAGSPAFDRAIAKGHAAIARAEGR